MTKPRLWLIAGPNGAGKTTYAFRHIRSVAGTTHFVNLDEIARGLSPLDPEAERQGAARVALSMASRFISTGRSFSIETTLAGRTHLRTIDRAKRAGFEIVLLFFAVASVETCLERIARRVAEGGHAVPEADARRRFARSLANFPAYAAASDLWRVFDNNGAKPRVVAEGRGTTATMLGDMDGLPPGLPERIEAFHHPAPMGEAAARSVAVEGQGRGE
jgi:predicted ABC-type ATPase